VLTITNGLWTQPDVVSIINEKYLDHINKTYNAQVMILPNESPESAVNNWVKRVTQGKIQKIVGEFFPVHLS
jgi:serine protease inhibitor